MSSGPNIAGSKRASAALEAARDSVARPLKVSKPAQPASVLAAGAAAVAAMEAGAGPASAAAAGAAAGAATASAEPAVLPRWRTNTGEPARAPGSNFSNWGGVSSVKDDKSLDDEVSGKLAAVFRTHDREMKKAHFEKTEAAALKAHTDAVHAHELLRLQQQLDDSLRKEAATAAAEVGVLPRRVVEQQLDDALRRIEILGYAAAEQAGQVQWREGKVDERNFLEVRKLQTVIRVRDEKDAASRALSKQMEDMATKRAALAKQLEKKVEERHDLKVGELERVIRERNATIQKLNDRALARPAQLELPQPQPAQLAPPQPFLHNPGFAPLNFYAAQFMHLQEVHRRQLQQQQPRLPAPPQLNELERAWNASFQQRHPYGGYAGPPQGNPGGGGA